MCNATLQLNLGYFTESSQVAEAPTYNNAGSQALREQSEPLQLSKFHQIVSNGVVSGTGSLLPIPPI